MNARFNLMHAAPGVIQAMLGLERQVRQAGLDDTLLHLVRMRASQINGCAYCLDMHSKDARADGETEQRLHGLAAWRETPYYSARERAALEWTETLTLLSETHVPDEAYDLVREQVLGERTGAPHAGHRGDQRMEPAQRGGADGTRRLRRRQHRPIARGRLNGSTAADRDRRG